MKIKINNNNFLICASVTIFVVVVMHSLTHENVSSSLITLTTNKFNNMKYVLVWARRRKLLEKLGRRGGEFHKRNCLFTNCYITWDKAFFDNVSVFDAILFHSRDIVHKVPQNVLPKERSPNQSYIFASQESSHVYDVRDARFDNIFNFTWTYKLNSDIKFGYITIRDHEGKVIGPNANIPWISVNDMLPVNETIKSKLANKNTAAAWFVSNCVTRSKRENIISEVIKELIVYNMTVDIYGKCGYKKCPRNSMKECLQMLQRDYYFYFAFENSFSEDYVTEKLLYALQNFAVPVVYGGANYKRFMPDGIYLNAREMTAIMLVKHMIRIIKDKERYQDFFKWHNHYSYHNPVEKPETDPYCSFCSFVNKINYSNVSKIQNFHKWWNG